MSSVEAPSDQQYLDVLKGRWDGWNEWMVDGPTMYWWHVWHFHFTSQTFKTAHVLTDTLTYSVCFCKVYVEILKTLHPYLKFHTVIKGNRMDGSDCIIVVHGTWEEVKINLWVQFRPSGASKEITSVMENGKRWNKLCIMDGHNEECQSTCPLLVPVRGTIPMNIPGHVGRCFFSKLWRKISKYCKIVGVGRTILDNPLSYCKVESLMGPYISGENC